MNIYSINYILIMDLNKLIKKIYKNISNYIYENNTYESIEVLNVVVKNITKLTNFEDIFKCPIEHRIFNFIYALQWLFFICSIIKKIKEYPNIDNFININFDIESSIIYLINIYSYKQIELEEYLHISDSDLELDTEI